MNNEIYNYFISAFAFIDQIYNIYIINRYKKSSSFVT